MSPLAKLGDVADGRVTGNATDTARIVLGIAAFLQLIDVYGGLTDLLAADALRTPMVSWLPVIPQASLPLFFLCWTLASLAFAAGLRTRLSGAVLAGILAYSISLDQQAYSNHVYLMVIVIALVATAGPGNGLSLDARMGRGQASVPAWPLTLVRVQMSIVYLFAAVSKLNPLYLSGAVIVAQARSSWLLPFPDGDIGWEVPFLLALGSILMEIFLAFGFWIGRYRRLALVVGITLHLGIVVLYPADSILPLTVFALVMFSMYTQFFRTDLLAMLIAKARVRAHVSNAAAARSGSQSSP